jgi:hypothetical protein
MPSSQLLSGLFPPAKDLVRKHLTLASVFYAALTLGYIILGMSSVVQGKFTLIQLPFIIFTWTIWFRAITNVDFSKGMITAPWANMIVQFLMPVFLFATVLYPKIKSEWGGGQPIDITLQLTKNSTLFSSQKVKLRLIDESELGFYVLLPGHQHALFVPRADVSVVSYSGDLSDMP